MKCAVAPLVAVRWFAGLGLMMLTSLGAADAGKALPELGAAPEWKLRQVDGEWLRSADLAGKVVVVDFWATWCGPCREEIPGYIAMQQELEAAGVVIVGVSLDRASPRIVRRFAEKFGINYPVVMGTDSVVDAFGGVTMVPTTILIDRAGRIRHRKEGVMHREDYEPLVRSLLEGSAGGKLEDDGA